MKALKCFAVYAALLAMGACSTQPASPEETAAFLDAVKGKTVVTADSGDTDFGTFNAEGKRFDISLEPVGYATFERAENSLTAYYKIHVAGKETSLKFVLNADKSGGQFVIADSTVQKFTFRSVASPEEAAAFLDTVKGKTLVVDFDFSTFTAEGKRMDMTGYPPDYALFEGAENSLTAYYQVYDETGKKREGDRSKFKIILKADKTGGEIIYWLVGGYPPSGLNFTLK